MKKIKKIKKEAAQEVQAQEQQLIKKCEICGTTCKSAVIKNIVPKYCYYCGNKLNYSPSK